MATDVVSSNAYMERELDSRIATLSKHLASDVLTYVGPIISGVDDLIRDAVEDISKKTKCLSVILETGGGYIDVTERIVTVFRHHYPDAVWFFVPNYAMSAGTILAMSGDRIFMDYYSTLGPIDPQVQSASGSLVPAIGYIQKYEELIARSASGAMTTAEMTYLVERFDPAELYSFEQARDLSIDLLKKWLVAYKFKNWTTTATSKKPVTDFFKKRRAEAIAKKLNDTKLWKSHGRGLSKKAMEDIVNLIIDDFSVEPSAQSGVDLRAYYELLRDYMQRRGHNMVIHTSSTGSYRGWSRQDG